MKNKIEEKKGITLITLILTVILMLILVSIATYTGLDTYNNAKVNRFVYKMQLIQAKIDELNGNETEEINNNLTSIDNINNSEEKEKYIAIIETAKNEDGNNEISSNSSSSDFKVLTSNDLKEILNIEDVEEVVLINFNTKEIVSTEGIDYEDKDGKQVHYYTQYKLPGGQQRNIEQQGLENNTLTFNCSTSYDGLNCTVTINEISIKNGTLEYELKGSNWKTITNYTETNKSYTVEISKSGSYTFKLTHNANPSDSVQSSIIITTTNKPKTNSDSNLNPYNYSSNDYTTKWAKKNDYVWIPRFVHKNNIVKFIKGNSNIATDIQYRSS